MHAFGRGRSRTPGRIQMLRPHRDTLLLVSHAPKAKASEKVTRPNTPAPMAGGSRRVRPHRPVSAVGSKSTRARLLPRGRGWGWGRERTGRVSGARPDAAPQWAELAGPTSYPDEGNYQPYARFSPRRKNGLAVWSGTHTSKTSTVRCGLQRLTLQL